MALTKSIRAAGVVGGDFEKKLAQASQAVRAEEEEGRRDFDFEKKLAPTPPRPADKTDRRSKGRAPVAPQSPEARVLQRARDLIHRARPATAEENELRRAAHAGQVDIVAELLNRGIDPNAADPVFLVTPLTLGAASGRNEIVRLLICAGADPNATTIDGRTALESAVLSNAPPSTVALLESLAASATTSNLDSSVQVTALATGTTKAEAKAVRGAAAEAETEKGSAVRSASAARRRAKPRLTSKQKPRRTASELEPDGSKSASKSTSKSASGPPRGSRDPKLRGMIRFVDANSGQVTFVHKSLCKIPGNEEDARAFRGSDGGVVLWMRGRRDRRPLPRVWRERERDF